MAGRTLRARWVTPLQFANQFSYLLFAAVFALVALFLLLRGEGSRAKQIAAVSILAVVAGVFFLARPGGLSANPQDAEEVLLTPGRPLFVEIYSKF